MLYRVIISHRQSKELYKFPKNIPTIVVLDCPMDDDYVACKTLGYSFVCIPQVGNRGANRNAGLGYLMSTYKLEPMDIVEFFDGDRYPLNAYSSEFLYNLMNESLYDCMLYTCGNYDARMSKVYVPLEGASPVDTGILCNPFYSCGFAITYKAITQVSKFNMGFLFEPRFTKWGCEDQYLGLICSTLGLRVGITAEITLNGKVGGDADMHSDYLKSLQTYIDLIRERHIPIRNVRLF